MVSKAKTALPGNKQESTARLGQKFGVIGDELRFTLSPPAKTAEKSADMEEDLQTTLQKIYDLVEAEPGWTREQKDKMARILAKYYHQEEPGFTEEEAYKSIIRDYQMVRDIPEIKPSKASPRGRKTAKINKSVSKAAANSKQTSPQVTLEDVMSGRPFSPADFMPADKPAKQLRNGRFQPYNINSGFPAMAAQSRRRISRRSAGGMGGMGGMMYGGMRGTGFPMGIAPLPMYGRFGRPW